MRLLPLHPFGVPLPIRCANREETVKGAAKLFCRRRDSCGRGGLRGAGASLRATGRGGVRLLPMEKKHFNAKHDDATWRGLFRRWHDGEKAPVLRAEAGVSHDTWTANAKRLGMRIRDLPADDPRRRRVPVFGERTGDYRHPKSLLDERDWLRVMALRAKGVRGSLLAEVFGVEHATICSQARARGVTPPHLVPPAPRPEMMFDVDLDKPVRTFLSLAETIGRAIDDGRHDDVDTLFRRWKMVEEMFVVKQRIDATDRARGRSPPGRGVW